MGLSSYIEAAMGIKLKDTSPFWTEYLAAIATHRKEMMQIPGSFISEDREAYDQPVSAQKIPERAARVFQRR